MRPVTRVALLSFISSVTAAGERATGLDRPFPEPIVRPDNPTTAEKVELGRLLFFDPIVSGDNTTSCAHCHHPDLAFSDGLPRARGKGSSGIGSERGGGVELPRAAPVLWNALFNHRQFWDGRASDLEDQAKNPITHPDEMDERPERLVEELKAIPDYARRFDGAFGDQGGAAVCFENVLRAVAAFERTLVSQDSRFDHFAAGDNGALTSTERRGLKLFLSTKARCNECHGLPAFANREFKVIGVPDPPDGPRETRNESAAPGRGGGPNGAFKVPTLRNIVLSAPYMHNGVFRTLEEVLDFYAKGGGRGRGLDVPLQDDKVRAFDLTAAEKADLIAFLGSLTDVSRLPEVPAGVPSGLAPVPRIPAAVARARELAGEVRPRPSPAPRRSLTIDVRPGESIQDAVDRAGPGGTVRVHPGAYHEHVLVVSNGVTIEGVVENGRRPLIDGRGTLADAISALGDRFSARGLEIRGFQGNGVIAHGAREVAFRDLEVHDPGLYGVYPVECEGVIVEDCKVSGSRDAGIYVGQSRRILVRRNEVYRNVAGIEIENSGDATVEDNFVHDNTGGILVFLLPFNPSKTAERTTVIRNRVVDNNTPNFGAPGSMVANVLAGTGILVLAADETLVRDNEVARNDTCGVAVSGLRGLFPPDTPFDVDPLPDRNLVQQNRLSGNGRKPDDRLKKAALPGADLLWDGTGTGNRWQGDAGTRFPMPLPE